ncbi:hypothetical protein ACHAXR_002249 [Thalassiosira sp. AJA248-18]
MAITFLDKALEMMTENAKNCGSLLFLLFSDGAPMRTWNHSWPNQPHRGHVDGAQYKSVGLGLPQWLTRESEKGMSSEGEADRSGVW